LENKQKMGRKIWVILLDKSRRFYSHPRQFQRMSLKITITCLTRPHSPSLALTRLTRPHSPYKPKKSLNHTPTLHPTNGLDAPKQHPASCNLSHSPSLALTHPINQKSLNHTPTLHPTNDLDAKAASRLL
jgi:hypothetical protein